MAVSLVSTGVQFPDSTIQTTAAGGGGFSNLVVFQTSGSWTVPSGVTKCKVTVIGGGGGSGNSTGNAGGGAGGCAIKICTVTPGAAITVTIGAGGTFGSADGTTAGGTSSFGAFCSATGGIRPQSNFKSGYGGLGVSGDINMRGGASDAYVNNISQGADSFFGGGGGANDGSGGAQTGIMGGGGGSISRAGGDGIIVIEY
jgi:hypothetical protein